MLLNTLVKESLRIGFAVKHEQSTLYIPHSTSRFNKF